MIAELNRVAHIQGINFIMIIRVKNIGKNIIIEDHKNLNNLNNKVFKSINNTKFVIIIIKSNNHNHNHSNKVIIFSNRIMNKSNKSNI